MKRLSNKRLKALMQDIPPKRRGQALALAHKLMIDGATEVGSDPEATGAAKVRVARDIVATSHQLESIYNLVAEEEATRHRIIHGISMNVAGANGAPVGCPPHVAAIWAKALAGEPDAEAIVDKWINDSAKDSRSDPGGES